MKILPLKLLSFLLPAGLAVVFLIWWFSPTRSVLRTSATLFASLEVHQLSLDTNEERSQQLGEILADTVVIEGPDPLPNEILSRDDLLEAHLEFQSAMLSSRFTATEESVSFPSPEEAVMTTLAEADLTIVGGQRRVMRYWLTLNFQKTGKTWRLSQFHAKLR